MTKLIILGSSIAIATADDENKHIVLVGAHGTPLVDCASGSILRLERAGLDRADITDLIVTQFHRDHLSGVLLLLLGMGLLGRRRPLSICGPSHAIQRGERI